MAAWSQDSLRDALRRALDLTLFPEIAEERAIDAIRNMDAIKFLALAPPEHRLTILYQNQDIIGRCNIMEDAFARAAFYYRVGNSQDHAILGSLIPRLNRVRLKKLSSSLPGVGPWTIYRGVAGKGRARRERGYSWTLDHERAQYFAGRSADLDSPSILRAVVQEKHILFYSDIKKDCFVLLPARFKVTAEPYRQPSRRKQLIADNPPGSASSRQISATALRISCP